MSVRAPKTKSIHGFKFWANQCMYYWHRIPKTAGINLDNHKFIHWLDTSISGRYYVDMAKGTLWVEEEEDLVLFVLTWT